MRLRLATETRSTVIELMGPCVTVTSGINTGTPGMAGAFTYEPYGAQFDFSNFQPIQETLDLAIKGPGRNVLDTLDSIQDFLEKIRLFHDSDLAAESCWLEWSAVGESEKRTLLYSGEFSVTSDGDVTPTLSSCEVIGKLSLTRHPLWENLVVGTETEVNMSTLGGKNDYTGVPGNTLARIYKARFYDTTAVNKYRFWAGIRRINQGVVGFIPLWECEWGTAGTDAALAADGTASPGGGGNTKFTVTYVTTTLASRMTITVLQVIAGAGVGTAAHFQGRYLVLLRCKLSAAGTSGIQLRYGYTGNMVAEEVYVDNTSWRLVPIGNISIPPWEGLEFSVGQFVNSFRLDVYTEQLTAGHNIYLDCLVLIPNEHLLEMEGADLDSIIPADHVQAQTMEDERDMAYEVKTATVNDAIDYTMADWYMPPGDGTIIVAAQNQTSHTIGEFISFSLSYYPRWTLYRGT